MYQSLLMLEDLIILRRELLIMLVLRCGKINLMILRAMCGQWDVCFMK